MIIFCSAKFQFNPFFAFRNRSRDAEALVNFSSARLPLLKYKINFKSLNEQRQAASSAGKSGFSSSNSTNLLCFLERERTKEGWEHDLKNIYSDNIFLFGSEKEEKFLFLVFLPLTHKLQTCLRACSLKDDKKENFPFLWNLSSSTPFLERHLFHNA